MYKVSRFKNKLTVCSAYTKIKQATSLSVVTLLFFGLVGCEKTLDYEGAAQETTESYAFTSDENKQKIESLFLDFYKMPIPTYQEFKRINNIYNYDAKNSTLIALEDEKTAITPVLSFYKELEEMSDKGLTKGQVEDFYNVYVKALEDKNSSGVMKYINSEVYIESLPYSDLLPKDEASSFGMMLGMGSAFGGMLGSSMEDQFVQSIFTFDQYIAQTPEQELIGNEYVTLLVPTLQVTKGADVIIVDKDLALLEVEGMKDLKAYYLVADLGQGLQIVSVTKTEAKAKELGRDILDAHNNISIEGQKALFEKRVAEIDTLLGVTKEVDTYLQAVKSAQEAKDIEKLNTLIDFAYIACIDSISGFPSINFGGDNNKPKGVDGVKYDFTKADKIKTDEDKVDFAKKLAEKLNNAKIIGFSKAGIVLDSSGYVLLQKDSNNNLVLQYVVSSISGFNPNEDYAQYNKMLDSLDLYRKDIIALGEEARNDELARKNMFELMYKQVEISKVEWEVVADGNSAITKLEAVAKNNSDAALDLRYIDLFFVKDNMIAHEESYRVNKTIPQGKSMKFNLSINSKSMLLYCLEKVEKGELELFIYPADYRYKGLTYSLTPEISKLRLKKENNAWVVGEFKITEPKATEFSLPQVNADLERQYKEEVSKQYEENKAKSIESINAFLDKVKITSKQEDQVLVLNFENTTNANVDYVEIQLEFTEDDVILVQYTLNNRFKLAPGGSEETKVKLNSEMLGYLGENAKITIYPLVVRSEFGYFKRDREYLLSEFLVPTLDGKEVIFSNKKEELPASETSTSNDNVVL